MGNSHLKYSFTCRLCQLNLLREEIRQKKSTLRSLQKESSFLKVPLQNELNLIDLFTSALFSSELMTRFWNQKVQFNRKSYKNFYRRARLKTIRKKGHAKGLNYCLPPKQLKYADYLVHFQLFHRDIHHLEVLAKEDLDVVRTKTKEIALSSFRQYNKNSI